MNCSKPHTRNPRAAARNPRNRRFPHEIRVSIEQRVQGWGEYSIIEYEYEYEYFEARRVRVRVRVYTFQTEYEYEYEYLQASTSTSTFGTLYTVSSNKHVNGFMSNNK